MTIASHRRRVSFLSCCFARWRDCGNRRRAKGRTAGQVINFWQVRSELWWSVRRRKYVQNLPKTSFVPFTNTVPVPVEHTQWHNNNPWYYRSPTSTGSLSDRRTSKSHSGLVDPKASHDSALTQHIFSFSRFVAVLSSLQWWGTVYCFIISRLYPVACSLWNNNNTENDDQSSHKK
jgi:hypothetical protein